MSMKEALRHLEGVVDWLKPNSQEELKEPLPPSPTDEAAALLTTALRAGEIDRESGTWLAVSRMAAQELIACQMALETATGDNAAYLRARCATLRDVMRFDQPRQRIEFVTDSGPDEG